MVVFSYFGNTLSTFLKLFLMNSEADMMLLHSTKGSHKKKIKLDLNEETIAYGKMSTNSTS